MSTQVENGRVHIQSLTPQLRFCLPSSVPSLNRKLDSELFFLSPLIKTQEHVHKRKDKKNFLFQRDLN